MRLQKTFQIDEHDKTFIVKELTVKEIMGLLQEDIAKADLSIDSFATILEKKFLPLATNIEYKYLLQMAPSEIEIVFNHFIEVNKSFFAVAQKMGLGEMISRLKESLIADFGILAVNSLKQDIPAS